MDKNKERLGLEKEVTYRPKDRREGYPRDLLYWQRRVFEIIPGLFLWFFLLLPFIFALLGWKTAFVIYVTFVVAYWFFRAIKFVIGVYIGVQRMEKSIAEDWVGKIKKLKDPRYEDLR